MVISLLVDQVSKMAKNWIREGEEIREGGENGKKTGSEKVGRAQFNLATPSDRLSSNGFSFEILLHIIHSRQF